MKFHLKAGEAIDVLSGDEYQDGVDKILGILRRSQRPPNSFHPTADAKTTIAGVLEDTAIYTVPAGMIAVVHRINIEAAGYTRASPLGTGYLDFGVGTTGSHDIFVGTPASPGAATAPCSIVDSVSSGQIVKEGQSVIVGGGSLPDSLQFAFRLQVLLWETQG